MVSWLGYVGPYMLCHRQWTLTLKNNSQHLLDPVGTEESSGSLNSVLREVKPGNAEKFIWKKTTASVLGAVGVLHFKIGDTGKVLSIFGCIPIDMTLNSSKCNLHIGSRAMTYSEMENGTGGCDHSVVGGQVGRNFDCTYTIANMADSEFKVAFNCTCATCNH